MNKREIIEALIFSHEGALELKDILKVVPDISREDMDSIVSELNSVYDKSGRSFEIQKASGGYMFVTREPFAPYIKGLRRHQRLSNAALEVLTVIAYKGPCTKQAIDRVRGVDSFSSLKTLIQSGLVEVRGGRPLKYVVSKKFLEVFGLDSLSELPDLDQFQEIFGKD